MDRRQALKNITVAFGCTIATPTLFGILESCSKTHHATNYLFLNQQQAYIINYLSRIILPLNDVSTKKTIDFVKFIDEMLYHTFTKEKQELFNTATTEFNKIFKLTFNKEVLKGTEQDFKIYLNTYFNIPKKEEENVFNLLKTDFSLIENQLKTKYLNYTFLTEIRHYCLFGYCTSEAFANTF